MQPKLCNIASDMILPNTSGDHVRSIKRDAPVAGVDLVNKDYVDTLIAGIHARGHTLLNATDHTDVATYLNQALLTGSSPTFAAVTIDNLNINGNTITTDNNLITLASGNVACSAGKHFSGDIDGTVLQAAQVNITSLGTLTTLTVDSISINDAKITSSTGTIDFDNENISVGGNLILSAGYVESKAYYYINGSKFISAPSTNMFIGLGAGNTNSTGVDNCYIGYGAGYSGNTNSYCIAIGYQAGYFNTVNSNFFIGYQAGVYTDDGAYNVMMGYRAGFYNVHSSYNVCLGYEAGFHSTGGSNVFIGFSTGWTCGTGAYNVCLGYSSGYYISTGGANIAIGHISGLGLSTGWYNTCIGFGTGYSCTAGSYNTFLGNEAGFYETGDNKLFIDYIRRGGEADARIKALIYGIFATATSDQFLAVNALLQVDQSIKIKERDAAPADTAAYGQIWVKNTTPCELWFTDDAGTDIKIS